MSLPQTSSSQPTLPKQQYSEPNYAAIEELLLTGNVALFTKEQQGIYLKELCRVLGMNSITMPFQFIRFKDGKMLPYATKGAGEQLRRIYNVSIDQIQINLSSDQDYEVLVSVSLPNGRKDQDLGVVNLKDCYGDARSNAKMKAVTKAKRRATLSICGLNMLDESELDTIQGAKTMQEFDPEESSFPAALDAKPPAQIQAPLEVVNIVKNPSTPSSEVKPQVLPREGVATKTSNKITQGQYKWLMDVAREKRVTLEQIQCRVKERFGHDMIGQLDKREEFTEIMADLKAYNPLEAAVKSAQATREQNQRLPQPNPDPEDSFESYPNPRGCS